MDGIQILMGVHDGAAHLPEQLRSLAAQSHRRWSLLVSDDSPGPQSREVIESFAEAVSQPIRIRTGPQRGFALNYMSLLGAAQPGPLALADQDDVWLPGKLARAAEALGQLPQDRPALYCARVQPWDGVNCARPMPPLARLPGFANALIENVAPGNTIVLNAAAAALARRHASKVRALFAHDWWLYQLISGVGGAVIRDDGPPVLLYRQHEGNAIGAGRGLTGQLHRKRAVFGGALAARLDLNAAALTHALAELSAENQALFESFEAARARPGPGRALALARLGLYRQRRLSTAAFLAATAMGLTG